ncbi:protein TRIGALACTOSYLDIACYLGLYCEROL 4, chloroplastic [Amborella trichopoda]|uniref:Protein TRIGALACTOSYLDIACYLGLYCEROL 4, chloroplastic n=1 Tax=Amborella trichopoda TaxID=13333 RepID=W1P272_AMBTC|nr:protein TRIGALACTOSYLDIACYLGLYCEROL 4, chloroplastic [Amborella trichopoda]XP_020520614.1 protein TRIGALACTOSYLDIACYLGLYCEROL 4, chloroplastic [Amborella trichopoda]XP_020520615.1 protein TRIGALACTOSYLDIACYLGLYCEROL 4, chloroplastic [Amborella trichopoda]XP_020520616.1 protein TRIGALACTOSYLDIACYLGLYCEROL 4, chloroplastic [Amborella trichopoda]ERN02018.1 hypothetical protein AMTR_s00045p00104390 [Amborella trichopoda]|eukprot:XP_006840343.1 protein TRIGALACTOSYLDIACYLGLYCEROL 4, chloroplastic [Amborella trichopoda]
MRKLRWAMDGEFWDLDLSTPVTLDGVARTVPGDPLPLSLSRGIRLSRPKQLDFFHRFMSLPLVPSYAGDPKEGGDGFNLQRVLAISIGERCMATILGQFHLQKLLSAIKDGKRKSPIGDSGIQKVWRNLCDKSLYALGFCSDFMITSNSSLLLSSEVYGDGQKRRNKAIFHHKLPEHNLTLEAAAPGLFVDKKGNYWDVPLSLAIDLASLPSTSGLGYHLCVHHNMGEPKKFGSGHIIGIPSTLLPGTSAKAALSFQKSVDIWRSKEGKVKNVQPYDMFLSDPHVSASGLIGSALCARFGGNSGAAPAESESSSIVRSLYSQAIRKRPEFSSDLFASLCCTAQYGNFQRLFFDLTRVNVRLDIPSATAFVTGATHLTNAIYKSKRVDLEAIHAVCPDITLSLQQQIAGPFSFRTDLKINPGNGEQLARVDEAIFAVDYALQVLGSARAVAWYSTKQRECILELRFFEH